MRHPLATLIAVVAPMALLVPDPAAAQEWQVARESFTFVGNQLTIHVDAEAPGTLRVIRGAPGSVRVASRTDRGFSAAGLAGNDELTLTSAGSGAVDYLVTVPDDVRVRVRLPGATLGESIPRRKRSRSFEWSHPDAASRDAGSAWLPPLHHETPHYTTFARDHAPALVSFPDLENVRSVSVRVEEGRFRAVTDRPLTTAEGSDDRLEIRPGAPSMDIVLVVPPGTRRFRVEAAGQTVLVMDDGSITALCSPMTQQWLSDGRRWLTFNPVGGALQCTAHTAPRHEG